MKQLHIPGALVPCSRCGDKYLSVLLDSLMRCRNCRASA